MNTHSHQRKNTLVHNGTVWEGNRLNVHDHAEAIAAFIEEFDTAFFSLSLGTIQLSVQKKCMLMLFQILCLFAQHFKWNREYSLIVHEYSI